MIINCWLLIYSYSAKKITSTAQVYVVIKNFFGKELVWFGEVIQMNL